MTRTAEPAPTLAPSTLDPAAIDAAAAEALTRTEPAPGGKGDRSRRRLLEIAVRRFASEGFRRTSVSEIAREAGLTPAAAYAYFAGKEALFKAAVDHDAAALIERARAAAAGPTIQARWGGLLGTLSTSLPEFPLARRVLAGQEPEVSGRMLELPSLAALRAELAADLRLGQARGEVRDDVDPDVLAVGFETLTVTVLMAQLQTGARDVTERAAGVLTVFDAAMRAPGRPG